MVHMLMFAALASPVQEDEGALAHADAVVALLEDLVKEDPARKDGRRWEALGDAYMVRAALTPKGETRKDFGRKAAKTFGPLASTFGGRFGEDTYRLLWKYARALAEHDLEALKTFFDNMTKRGHAPGWDEDAEGKSRWGWRDKLEKLRPKP